MSKAQAIRLGPFTGGMNTASDPTAVADAELVDAVNFELDLDASYVCRPPIVETTNIAAAPDRVVMIGRAILAGVSYVIGSSASGTWAFNGTVWTLIKANLESRVAVQFQDKLFVVATPNSVQSGGYWDGAVWTDDLNMPRGEAAVFHKARLYIAPGITATGPAAHQVKYSDPIPISAPVPLVWTATSVLSVGQGDGEKLTDIVVYNDNLVIFKQDSTYVLAFDTQPVDAILRNINPNIGATSRRCVVQYENSLFVFHEGNIFEIVNFDFQRINFKVPFLLDGFAPTTRTEEVFMCLLGDRLLLRYYNRVYVYGLKTRTWTRWLSNSAVLHNFGPLVPMPAADLVQTLTRYYGGSCLFMRKNVFYIQDGYDAAATERELAINYDIECTIVTKNYDLADSHHFKKLFWWGADVLTNRNIAAIVKPVSADESVKWSDLTTHPWVDLSTSTWASPLNPTSFVIQTNVLDTSISIRKFVKFLKALRWRSINYKIIMLCDGSVGQGPCRLFTLTAIVASKETVVKQVN